MWGEESLFSKRVLPPTKKQNKNKKRIINMADFFSSVWNYLYEAYIEMDGSFGGSDTLVTVGMVVLGLYIGSVIACVIMTYNRQLLGTAVRKMLSMDITSRENAKTVEELGYKKNFFIRSLFRDSDSLRRVIKCVEEDDFYADQEKEREELEEARKENKKLRKFKTKIYRADIDNDHFYIPQDLHDLAERRFNKKGSTWVSMIFAIIALTVIFVALLFFLPWFFGLLGG